MGWKSGTRGKTRGSRWTDGWTGEIKGWKHTRAYEHFGFRAAAGWEIRALDDYFPTFLSLLLLFLHLCLSCSVFFVLLFLHFTDRLSLSRRAIGRWSVLVDFLGAKQEARGEVGLRMATRTDKSAGSISVSFLTVEQRTAHIYKVEYTSGGTVGIKV